MFKDEADFKKIIGRLNIDTEPNPVHREKLRRRMLSVFNQTEQKPTSRIIVFRTLRRLIMKSPVTKIATAAAIIIAIFIGIHYLGGSIDGASVVWSQVVEQISSHTKYKCRQRVVREKGPEFPTMQVYHLNLQQRRQDLSQRRQEVEDGSIHIIDMRGTDAITVELDPANKKATVTKLIGFGPRKDPHIIEMVKRFEQESTERLGTKKQNGKILHGFRHLPNEHNDYTVWVDPDTKLPVEIELKHVKRGQTIFLDR
jgi:outer membrane lipoprotein-sorting protein